MARPTKLTPEVQTKIVQALTAGNYFETACQYAGIAKAIGYEWLARGENRDPKRKKTQLYADFADAIRLAEAHAEVRAVALIQKEMPDNARLALDFLARRHPERWGPKEKHEITGKGGGPVEHAHSIDLSGLSDEELHQLETILGKTAKPGGDPG